MTTTEFQLFLPQMRMSFPTLVEKARAAEDAGFDGLALMDHLAPPMAESHDMFDAMVTAAWLAAHTERLTIGHLVLCDTFRQPAVLAKQAVSLDHASNGRFELGIGWGSVPAEFDRFGVGSTEAPVRVARLRETLEVLDQLFTGEPVTYDGAHHVLDAGQQQPTPTRELPVVIGGTGPRTLELVAAHADWWNCPTHALDRFETMRHRVGDARASIQRMVAYVPSPSQREAVETITARRYGAWGDQGPLVGDAGEVIADFRRLADLGVERFYVWFTDFASVETLEAFGNDVIAGFD